MSRLNWIITILNIVSWPVIHFVVSKWVMSLPLDFFQKSPWLYRIFSWESDGDFWQKVLRVKQWKRLLPDGTWFMRGGFSKAKVKSKRADYLNEFLIETCRAEFAHWITFCFFPIFWIWNPLWACVVMFTYATLSNIPCIVAQRYNRAKLARLNAIKCYRSSNVAAVGR